MIESDIRETSDGRIITHHEVFVAACRGRLRLMLDVKEPKHAPAFYEEMERELKTVDLLQSAYVIGLESAHKFFKGKTRISVDNRRLREAVSRNEPVSKLYFLFEWGGDTDS